ncbi:MAG: efflux RND transporter periplasmic adaptor subunit [Akkermansia sp.]
MYNKPLTFAATTLLLCSPVMILTSCEGEKDSAAQAPALVPEVQVTKLVTKDVPIRQEWVGTLRGTEDAEIRSQVTGYLLSKDYRDGAYVKKGQVLFQIDPRPFQATLDQAQGRLEQYEATLKKYKLDVERYTPLVKTGSVSRKQLDDALQQVQETEAAIATAKAQVDEAKINQIHHIRPHFRSGRPGNSFHQQPADALQPQSADHHFPIDPIAWTSP